MNSKQALEALRKFESRNITFMEPDGSWPIVWDRARGAHVWDAEGRKYLDLTAAFGVAACGHANRKVVRAGQQQMAKLLHAMGDVHPHELKARLARELSRVTFERWAALFPSRSPGNAKSSSGKTILCNSGFEAVEAALKTALLATGRPGIIAFEGAYHGLGYGALNATHRRHFRAPFKSQLAKFGCFASFPSADSGAAGLAATAKAVKAAFRKRKIGAVLVEPAQVRGGVRIPDAGFLSLLRGLCDEHGSLLILDEIYTGFGRTGAWFACEHSAVAPDIICLGKALTGGFPMSACVGAADTMDAAWPASSGEAIHTSTFLGHPVGCAMALAQIREIQAGRLVRRAAQTGRWLLAELEKMTGSRGSLKVSARGIGLLAGLELSDSRGGPATDAAIRVLKGMLQRGYIMLPEGEFSNVLSFSPPLIISEGQLRGALKTLRELIENA
jgi:4-aminobutyrate aminotransferase-like enzyme